MSIAWSIASVIALWIGCSCGLWWLHWRRLHSRQQKQIEQANRAADHVREAQRVFDLIRSPTPPTLPADSDALFIADTHALLKRVQEQGSFFNKVNALRVQIQASTSIEDHAPLSEILHLRRDLWAASEIILVEDPRSFGESFSEDGAYERFHSEALRLLFKRGDSVSREEDLIDTRLSLARKDAERFIAELVEAIRIARKRDRLPTLSEIVAYPLAILRTIPKKLRAAYAFMKAFLGDASDIARSIRRSEAVALGAARFQSARENWPQRLSAGLERASTATLGSAAALRRHYDFLVAAHDFHTKYERLLRRAPEITEHGRQFITRLELAERSERLRLNSTNATIWAVRKLIDGSAHLIAGLLRLYAVLSATAAWKFGAAIFAREPVGIRRASNFRSYRMALAVSGLKEVQLPSVRPALVRAPRHSAKAVSKVVAPMRTGPDKKSAKAKSLETKAVLTPEQPPPTTAKPPKGKPHSKRNNRSATAKAAKIVARSESRITKEAASKRRRAKPSVNPTRNGEPLEPRRASWLAIFARNHDEQKTQEVEVEASAERMKQQVDTPIVKAEPPARQRNPVRSRKKTKAKAAQVKKQPAIESSSEQPVAVAATAPLTVQAGTVAQPLNEAAQEHSPPPNEEIVAPAEKPPSFFKRFFGKRNAAKDGARPEVHFDQRPLDETSALEDPHAPDDLESTEPPPALMAKLSGLDGIENHVEDGGPADDAGDEDASEADEPGALTLSLMELQAKIKPNAPQIRSFPWLRG